MDYAPEFLGRYIAAKLTTRNRAAVLTIGRDHFTRADLAHVECFHFLAAQRLTRALEELGAKSVRDVFDRLSPLDLALPQVGAISLAVLGAAFEARRLTPKGASPLAAWVTKHTDPEHPKHVTFHTVKATATKRLKAEDENPDRAAARARRRKRTR